MLRLAPLALPTTIDAIEGAETSAKRRLIAAGEHLLGQQGFDAAPLHEIAAHTGQSNRYAVQYHFGDRAGLVQAIFAIRRRRIHQRRQQLAELAGGQGLLEDVRALLEVIFLPVAEQVDAEGHHSYARFLLHYLSRISFDPATDDPFTPNADLKRAMIERIARIVGLPLPVMEWRCYQQQFALLAALGTRDNPHFQAGPKLSIEVMVGEVLDGMALALRAPVSDPQVLAAAKPIPPRHATAA